MPLIQVPVGVAPCQVDDFPEKVGKDKEARPFERSCKGALYLRPATTRKLTDDEWDHIKNAKQHRELGKRLFVVKVTTVPAKAKAKSEDTTKPSLEPAVMAAEERKLKTDEPAPEPDSGSGSVFGGRKKKDKNK